MKTITIRSKQNPSQEFVENYFDNQSEAEHFLKLFIKPETIVISTRPNTLIIEVNRDTITYKIEELSF